jgi:hypothetical protein
MCWIVANWITAKWGEGNAMIYTHARAANMDGPHVHAWSLGPEVAGVSHGVCCCGAERDFEPNADGRESFRKYKIKQRDAARAKDAKGRYA